MLQLFKGQHKKWQCIFVNTSVYEKDQRERLYILSERPKSVFLLLIRIIIYQYIKAMSSWKS